MMSNKPNLGSINFRKYPYRGILSEIARIVGRTPETVGEGVRRGNPKYCEMAAKEIQR
jgi:predicted transcriptional regulator with HTH domain